MINNSEPWETYQLPGLDISSPQLARTSRGCKRISTLAFFCPTCKPLPFRKCSTPQFCNFVSKRAPEKIEESPLVPMVIASNPKVLVLKNRVLLSKCKRVFQVLKIYINIPMVWLSTLWTGVSNWYFSTLFHVKFRTCLCWWQWWTVKAQLPETPKQY